MAELADAHGLGPCGVTLGGSSPLIRTQHMESTIKREDDGTIILNISIPQSQIKKSTEETIDETTKVANVPGFRKGKAPKKIVSDRIDKEKIKEEVLKKLLPLAYTEAVRKHDIKPIINPRIHVEELSDDKDWRFTASTCEAPEIDLNGYKENVSKITAKGKIILPGTKEPKGVPFDEILKELEKSVSIKISKIIVEQEVERLLAQTLDEIKRLGLTLDQYLASTKRSIEDLKKEYEIKAMNDIKLEFALSKIAEEEKISVDNVEIEEAIKKAKDETERRNLESNKYVLASILRQQKTLDFLKSL